jgi:hypothetical protein
MGGLATPPTTSFVVGARGGSDRRRLAVPARPARPGAAAQMVSPATGRRSQPGHSILTAALAMDGDPTAAAARDTLLRLWPDFSLAWMTENSPVTEEYAERFREGLRKAGVPEE